MQYHEASMGQVLGKLSTVEINCRIECDVLTDFLRSLDNYFRVLLLSGGLKLPFQKQTCDTARRLSLFLSINYKKLGINLSIEIP